MINCPDFPIPYRKKGLYSNVMKVTLEDDMHYSFSLGPHPLSWWGRHHPDFVHIFKPVECLLLLQQNEHFQDNYQHFERIENQIKKEIKHFSYHPISLILAIAISLFAIISSIINPELYNTGGEDGVAWGFLFGISTLMGLFVCGKDKQMMARGWEYRCMLYMAVGALMILFCIPQDYYWQRMLYLLFIIVDCFWAYFCYRRWSKDKVGLDKIEQTNLAFEARL